MCMEEHLLGAASPLNGSPYLEGLVSSFWPEDTLGNKKKYMRNKTQRKGRVRNEDEEGTKTNWTILIRN